MFQKTFVAAGVALLVIALLAGASAHLTAKNTNGTGAARSFGVGGPANPDPCRRLSLSDSAGLLDACPLGAPHLSVSGSFVGESGAIVFKSPVPLNNPRAEVCDTPEVRLNQAPCPEGGSLFLLEPTTLFPNGGVSAGLTLCDMEVLGDGTDDDVEQAFDEFVVDSAVNDSPNKRIPDGTVDDGGSGGACHVGVMDLHYLHPGYKTSGCGGTVAGTDWVQGGHAWFGVGCTYFTVLGASGASLSTCVVNAAIGSDKVGAANRCVSDFTAPPGDDGEAQIRCFGGQEVQFINFGEGTGRNGLGIPFPAPPVINCPDAQQPDAAAVVFAFGSVSVDTSIMSPLVGGWIDG